MAILARNLRLCNWRIITRSCSVGTPAQQSSQWSHSSYSAWNGVRVSEHVVSCNTECGLLQVAIHIASEQVLCALCDSLTRFLIFMCCLYKCVAAKLMFVMANSSKESNVPAGPTHNKYLCFRWGGRSKKLMHIKIFQTTIVKLTEVYIQ